MRESENPFHGPKLTMADYAGDLVAVGVVFVTIAVLAFVAPHYMFWR